MVVFAGSKVRERIGVPCHLDSISLPRLVANQRSITGEIELTHSISLNPDSIAVAGRFLAESVKTATDLVAQLQDKPAVLTDDRCLIAALFGRLILHLAL